MNHTVVFPTLTRSYAKALDFFALSLSSGSETLSAAGRPSSRLGTMSRTYFGDVASGCKCGDK